MNDLRTTPTSTRTFPAIRKAKEPAEQSADQFASMFASFCIVPLPQLPSTPEAKSAEGALAGSLAIPETVGADSTPVLGSETLATETDQVSTPQTLGEGALLTGQPANWISPEQTFRGLALAASQTDREATRPNVEPATVMPDVTAAQSQETAVPLSLAPIAETMKPGLETAANGSHLPLEPQVILALSEQTSNELPVQAALAQTSSPTSADSEPAAAPVWQLHVPDNTPNEGLKAAVSLPQINSSQRQDGAAPAAAAPIAEPSPTTSPVILVTPIPATAEPTTKRRSGMVAEAPILQNTPPVANNNLAEQTLQTEGTRRDANLLAGYLAETTRNDRDGKGSSGVKTFPAHTGFDLAEENVGRDSDLDPRLQVSPLAGKVSFAATVRDIQSGANSSSIQSQAINQIIAQAEFLQGHQTRSLRLRLRPEELGQIDIQLSRDAAGRISGHIYAEREAARGTLSRSLDELRETLTRAGITIDKLQISAHPGLSNGNREAHDAPSNTRASSSTVANLLTENETESDRQHSAETERLLSLRA
jgi:flagellar hook-length control protein FliK